MDSKNENLGMKIGVTIAYIVMVGMNFLANYLPINGVTTGEVSDAYSNLFTPAGVTFSIWGLIYFLLFLFVLYQWGLFRKDKETSQPIKELVQKVRVPFIVTAIANPLWLILWHYDLIGLSTILMLVLLVTLIWISRLLARRSFSIRDYIFLRLPFSIYFGWITVATIANITIMLISWGWEGFGIAESTWTIIILIVGAAIGIATTLRNRDAAYGLTIIWGYIGILINHMSAEGWNSQFPNVIFTLYATLAAILVIMIIAAYRQIKLENQHS